MSSPETPAAPATADIGVVGLAVMGSNLARNFARHGHTVALFNRTATRTRELVAEHGGDGDFVPSEDLAAFVASLKRPRRILLMVKAGDATDATIESLIPHLEPGDIVDLAFHERAERHPPLVALCDISGSMADYTRVFLHFLHAIMDARRRVHAFVFATRLTNITRELRAKDPDEALAAAALRAQDWEGGTRLGACIHAFNRDWSRRVLGQGATVLFFSDGLERQNVDSLRFEMDRLRRSARRVVWLNPLLRFDGFEAKAEGIRAILPFVDEMRPIHNLSSMADLAAALSSAPDGRFAPRRWLAAAA